MKSNDYFLFVGFLLVVIAVLIFINWRTVKDLFTSQRVCERNADCIKGEFCHDQLCKPFWNGLNMPWYNCSDPAYCVEMSIRQPCGLRQNMILPKCGTTCIQDGDCPLACPKCIKGICSSPQ